jgi:transketolase
MTVMNTNLQALQKALVLQHDALFARLSTATSVTEVNAISTEMDEVYLRIRVTTRLLFSQTTGAIDKQITDVVAVSAELQQSIKTITKLKDLIKKTGKFLGLVDKILDVVKLV